MKRFVEYNIVEAEIKQLFGTADDYQAKLRRFDDHPGGDYEKLYIANLLFLRGKREESRKMLESIEDEEYREECLEDSIAWGAEPGCIVN